MAEKKRYDDDDGRTIADMSGIERTPMLVPKFPKAKSSQSEAENAEASDERPWEQQGLSKQERRSFIFGAMSATALIALLFIAAGAIAIALFILFTR
ncbi:MAG: hypothetical protein IJK26_08785 [Clostridia bacterium]|nr:hypothetical protein [Clostridia bacterium]